MPEAISTYSPDLQPPTENVPHCDELRLLSVNETRKLLGIRYETVLKLINNGEIETIQINGKKRIPMVMLRKFVIKNSIAVNQKREAVQDFDSSELNHKLQKIINKHRKEVN
jgi:excisionase family DNA binding protein